MAAPTGRESTRDDQSLVHVEPGTSRMDDLH
jgi:hypothetical protein